MTTKKKFDPKQFIINNAIYLILLALVVIITIISPRFFSLDVARDILMQSSVRIVVAMGCMFIIVSGSADLSGGRMVGLTALVSASLYAAPRVFQNGDIYELGYRINLTV